MSHIIHKLDWWKILLERLKNRGISPLTAIDIGANVGQWYSGFKEVFPNANVLSIEANPQCEAELKTLNPNTIITLMGRENNSDGVEMYVNPDANNDVGASIYRETTKWGMNAQPIKIPMVTLDSLNRKFDWIKMDVQGAELDVLKGGIETLSRAMIVELELSLMRYNEGAPLASEIISWMWNHGFEMFEVTEIMYLEENGDGNNKTFQMNVLFLNRDYGHLLDVIG